MSKNKLVNTLFWIVAVVITAGIFGGCIKAGSNSNTNSTNLSFVSLMNMAPYSSSMEVFFNGDKKTPVITPGSYSSSYGQLPPGSYDIKFKVAGADSVLSSLPASNYDSMGFYTLILYNTPGGANVSSMKITDDFSTLSVTGANYRFFNLCPDYSAVDLYMNTTLTQPGRSVADNAYSSYFNSFVPVTPGGYSLSVKKAGTDSVLATISSIGLVQGNAYTIFLMGSTHNSNNPISLAVLQAAY